MFFVGMSANRAISQLSKVRCYHHFYVCLRIYSQLSVRRTLWNRPQVSVIERCPFYRESNKGSKERQGTKLIEGVHFTKVSV